MKTIRFAAFLLYRYFSSGQSSIGLEFNRYSRYTLTISVLTMIVLLHLLTLCFVLNRFYHDLFNLLFVNNSYLLLSVILVLAILSFIIARFIKEDLLAQINYSKEEINKGNKILIGYIIATVTLLLISLSLQKNH